MKTSLYKLIDICKLLVVFMTLTIFFYGLIIWAAERVEQYQRQEGPQGRSIKVTHVQVPPPVHNLINFKDRLFFYYWFGE